MKLRIFIVIVALVASACGSEKSSIMQQSTFDSRPALIFIHGYYGSTLRDVGSRRRIFLSAREILFGRNALSLFQEELATPPGPRLEVEGLFGGVPVLPIFYNVDVYGEFVKYAQALPGVQVVPMAYDWREDLGLAVNQLDALVHALRAKGVSRITIMAHSMGGMVASYYLGYGSQPRESAKLNWAGAKQIERVIFLGTPFQGCFSVFRNMQRGADFPWNRKLLPAETVASFPASYAVMPVSAVFKDLGQNPVPTNLSDFHFWEKNKLGLLRSGDLPGNIRQARVKFTAEQLARAKKFADRINFVHETALPPASLNVTNVVGKDRDTVSSAFFDPASGELIFDTDKPAKRNLPEKELYSPGDGTVPLTSSALPALLAKNAKVIYSELSHDRLFDDKNVKSEVEKTFAQ